METLNPVPAPAFALSYNGRAITQDIAPYVISATYTDHLTGEADSLEIELEDADGRWLSRWYPEKGASLAYRFGYLDAPLIAAGRFDIDELELAGPPSTVRIKALAAGVQHAVRTRRGRAYEKTTLAAIAQRIAKRHKMTLVGKIESLSIDRATQYQESDLAFLQRLAGQYGYAFKVTENNTRLVFWKTADLHLQQAIRRYTPQDLASWHFRDKVSDVPADVEVKHHNTKTKKLVVYGVKDGETTVVGSTTAGRATSADTVKVTRRAPNKASAEVQARAELDRRLLERTEGEIRLEGDPGVAAGANIELVGFGLVSGLYTIALATHTIIRNAGYTTSLELKRAAPPATATKAVPAKPKGLQVYGMQDGRVQVVDTSAKKGQK
ncbi:MAG TPA: contractile injection system protein, VgrG/Pvc8 family [Paucimonas sp.]|nr:contractile injection system protein, VgrG/Pvc8 family [Paucimonas sp.]